MSNTEIKRPVLSLNVVGPSDDNNEFIVGTMVDGNDQYPAIQFGGTTLEAQNGELHISGDLVVDGDVYTDGSDEPVGPGGGTHVAANSGGVTTDTLRTLQVGDVNYSVPERVIIVPNEDGMVPTETLETLQIGETVYGIPSGGGSDILDSDNIFTGVNTFEQPINVTTIGKTITIEGHGEDGSVMDFSAEYNPEDSLSSASFELNVSAPDAPASHYMSMNTDGAWYIESNISRGNLNNFINTTNIVKSEIDDYTGVDSIVLSKESRASFGGSEFESNGSISLKAIPIVNEENPGEIVDLKSVINLQANEVLVNGEPIGSSGGSEPYILDFRDWSWSQSGNIPRGFSFRKLINTDWVYIGTDASEDRVNEVIDAIEKHRDIYVTIWFPLITSVIFTQGELISLYDNDRVALNIKVAGYGPYNRPNPREGVDGGYEFVLNMPICMERKVQNPDTGEETMYYEIISGTNIVGESTASAPK